MISIARPAPPETAQVVVARHPLAAGHVITEEDITTTNWPTAVGLPPSSSSIRELRGRTTAGPIEAGEPVSSTRLVGPGLLELSARATGDTVDGFVAAPVRLADAGQTGLIRPGDTVDVIAARAIDGGGQTADVVAINARVITITDTSASAGSMLGGSDEAEMNSSETGNLIVLAVSAETARELAAAATRSRISVVLKSNPSLPPRPAG